ncbi:MAG: four helix bundle protein [Terriglobia bacterium]|jgi:four helix bundle protein
MTPEGEINSYRDLLVWQKGMALAKQIYLMTRAFPDDERFGLITQMRRAAVSVPSNIAEGQARQGRNEFVQFLSYAEGSLAELDTQLKLADDLGYCRNLNVPKTAGMVVELQKMTASLRRKVITRLATSG